MVSEAEEFEFRARAEKESGMQAKPAAPEKSLWGEVKAGFEREAPKGGLIGGAVGAAAGAAGYGMDVLSHATGQVARKGAEAIGADPMGFIAKGAEFVGETAPSIIAGGGVGKQAGTQIARPVAEHLMTSALKPTLEAARTGKAARAIKTMLDEGISVSKGGMSKLRGLIDELNSEIKDKISKSTATVNKAQVAKYLDDLTEKFKTQVNPKSDLDAIRTSFEEFMGHPSLAGRSEMSVQEAQKLKQGTYKSLSSKAYGEEKTAATEAQKTLARGLKEEVAKKVPEVVSLNAKETELLNALNVTERRMLVELNKNPAGLTWLAHNPASAMAFMADRSAHFKSLAARIINRSGGAAGAATGAATGAIGQRRLGGAPPDY